jgi:hypothetical protein
VQVGTQVWLDRFLTTFEVGGFQPAERHTGARDAAADAAGAHIVTFLGGDAHFLATGGEAAYLRQPGLPCEGFVVGWERWHRSFFNHYGLDAEGYLASLPSYARVKESEIGALPPTLQLLARARYALFGVLVVEKGLGAKRKHTHVAVDVSAGAYLRAAGIQFKYNITAAFAGDASRDVWRDAEGRVQFDEAGAVQLVTFAAVRHSGTKSAGTMLEPEESDNYLGVSWERC